MSEENIEAVQAYIDAYNRRDFDVAMERFSPEIDWILPERQASDSCRGPEEIERFWRGLDETFEELRLEPQEHVAAGNLVVTRLRHHGRGKGSGLELNVELYHQVATFDGETIVRLEYFGEWEEALTAAGVSAPSASRARASTRQAP